MINTAKEEKREVAWKRHYKKPKETKEGSWLWLVKGKSGNKITCGKAIDGGEE